MAEMYCDECDNVILISDGYNKIIKFLHPEEDIVRICDECEKEGC